MSKTQTHGPNANTNPLSQQLLEIYRLLFERYGPQHWWPGETPFEMIIGAILTQSTAWTNVEKAIANLKQAGTLNPSALRNLSLDDLSRLIYSCGYYRMKALKVKAFVEKLGKDYDDSLDRLFAANLPALRRELLSIYGIGEETADSIILYAARKPVFVIDAYTRRVVDRVGIPVSGNGYSAYQKLFMDNLPHDERMFNEYHALFVRHCKEACRKRPLQSECCLREICRFARRAG